VSEARFLNSIMPRRFIVTVFIIFVQALQEDGSIRAQASDPWDLSPNSSSLNRTHALVIGPVR